MNEFFGPLVPGQMGCVFDHAGRDLVLGHIDVTETLIAGTGFLFAPRDHRTRRHLRRHRLRTIALFRCMQMVLAPR